MAATQATPEGAIPSNAGGVYRARMADLRGEEARLQRRHLQLGWLRLALGVGFVVFLLPPRWYAAVLFVCFGVAARVHQGVLARLAATRRTTAMFERGLARREDRWEALPARQPRQRLAEHLYADDLDLLTGPKNLFLLLCEARTSLGEDTLADWMLSRPKIEEVQRRQRAVMDLRNRVSLREGFAAAPGPAVANLNLPELEQWATAPRADLPHALRWLAPVLVLLTVLAAWRYAVSHSPVLLIAALAIDAGLTFRYRRTFDTLFPEAERASRSLKTAAALLGAIETEHVANPFSEPMRDASHAAGTPASAALFALASVTQWAEARSNYVVRILDAPLLYSLQLAFATERWRLKYGPHLATWLRELGETEALLSLATYSYEHPADPFPSFADAQPVFQATGLGHPLLPESQCVRNDVALDAGTQMLLVSGSNMSGKSTLLRSVGINAVLGFMGAPVRAHSLVLSPLTIAASIQVSDSLQAGRSRFYAEILRLRAITEAAKNEAPVLFLVDEVLAGTNSSDRLAGAQGFVAELLRSGAIGLLSTHDLALTELATGDRDKIRNVHFEDQVSDGELRFDYQLRDGVVERSNGLALMRLIGLDV